VQVWNLIVVPLDSGLQKGIQTHILAPRSRTCVFTLWVPCCGIRYYFRIKKMFASTCLQLFVGGLMAYLRYLCLFAHSGVQHIVRCVSALFFFVYSSKLHSLNCHNSETPLFIFINSISKSHWKHMFVIVFWCLGCYIFVLTPCRFLHIRKYN